MNEGTIATVLVFPRPWPPDADSVSLLSRAQGDSVVELTADRRGRLGLRINSAALAEQSRLFQPVGAPEGGRGILIETWSPNHISLSLNGIDLLPDEEQVGQSITISSLPERAPIFEDADVAWIDPTKGGDEAEHLFLATLMDIQEKLARRTRYDLIKAAGLLRLLLLDDMPLVYKVNRGVHLRLHFTVVDYTTPPPVVPDHHWQNLDPSMFPGARTLSIDLKTLLSAPCLTTDGVSASVKDLIKACANAKGGIHLGKACTSEEAAVLDWDQAVRLVGEEPSGAAIAGLCRVVVAGLRPLAEAILMSA